MDTVDEFLGKDCEFLIGVHCTHGLNRTGYMVCRYMRDRLGVPAKDAIKKFEKARGYQIERENYIADLLGSKPPPPDVGRDTHIKPVSVKRTPYKRSPLEEDVDEDEGRSRDRYNRYNRNSDRTYDRYNPSRSSGSDRNGFWNTRANNDSNWRRRGDSESSGYDYKRDY
uniref:Tyrosine specific protein phosphatases domain-containing protein n=1 Tax=Heliothis virescens TaxID=7102 RepID=A0A2A4JI19_HELVI